MTIRRRGSGLALVGTAGLMALLSGCISFDAPVPHEATSVESAWAQYVRYADVTGDGIDEVIVGTSDGVTTQMRPCGSGCLEPAAVLPVFGDLAAADLDGDGTQDLVVADQVTGVRVYFGSDGTNRPAGLDSTDSISLGGSDVKEVIAGDLTGDGPADIGFVGFDPQTSLSYRYAIFPGDGTGGFGPLTTVISAVLVVMSELEIGDVDGDGRVEGVIAEVGYDDFGQVVSSGVEALSPTGQSIRAWGSPNPTDIRNLAVGDVDGDGRDDVVVRHAGSPSAMVALRSGDAAFGPFGTASVTPNLDASAYDVALQDVNGDGMADLLAVGVGDESAPGVLSWWRATTNGFAPTGRKERALPFVPRNLAVGHVGSSLPELLIGHRDGPRGTYSTLTNLSDG